MDAIADGIWTTTRPMKFWHVECGTRMTIVRLRDGSLFVHSPVALDAATRAEVDAMGPVAAVVAPSRFHHVFVTQWRDAYPGARLYACPGLERKRADVRWDRVLRDDPDDAWRGHLQQVYFGGRLEHEVVFFHPPSRTLVCCDMVFNLAKHPSRLTRAAARLLGNREPGATWLEHVMMHRREAREQIDRMLAWEFDRILLAHGDPVVAGGSEVLRKAYAWL